MAMDYKSSAKLLLGYDDFLILTHKNPDGDTMGSAAALCSALRRVGKTAWLYPNVQTSKKLMAYVGEFYAPEDFKPRSVISVDTATESLMPKGYRGGADFCVDHHPTNSRYAKQYLIKDEKASCGEIVLELIKELCGDVTAQEATLLYIAVSTDTGCFQYLNTRPDTLRAAAELMDLGAESGKVNVQFFRKLSPARLKLEGMAINGMELHRDGLISLVTVTQDMLNACGATEDDLDDLANIAGRAETSRLNVTIREMPDGSSKLSLRSGPDINVSDICAVFGGGGHAMAAGCTIDASPEKAKELILSVIDEVWK